MKKRIYILSMIVSIVSISSCQKDILNTKIDTELTPTNISSDYTQLWNFGYAPYTYLQNGFTALDNNLFAAATDNAIQTAPSSNAQLFNEGSWNAYNNPDNVWDNDYNGIHAVNFFLAFSENYKTFLALNRDTISDHQYQYSRDVQDIAWLRAEDHILRAYFYFDLSKRYGGVPLVTTVLPPDSTNIPRVSYDDIITFIVSEIDAVKDSLQTNWSNYDVSRAGRITLGTALALKARVLLFAASPLHNTSDDITKWEKAAQAAHDVIALNQYSLDPNYQQLFVGDNTINSPETIWAIRLGSTNTLEQENYPIGTPGGHSGVTPSQNLVSAYEYMGPPDPNNPYVNRDPRLGYTVVTNNSQWNGRTIQIWPGGTDNENNINASRTGYYLKKFLNDNLNLTQNGMKLRSWIIFRYAGILLDYAEAMNEAYGPDNDNGWGLTARQAINEVRARPSVNMPPVQATNQNEMRSAIKHERRIELAFEGYRFWDLLRWKDAATTLNQPLLGIKVNNVNGTFTYTADTIEKRVFIAPKMYYYPIPYTEISKSHGVLQQNPDW